MLYSKIERTYNLYDEYIISSTRVFATWIAPTTKHGTPGRCKSWKPKNTERQSNIFFRRFLTFKVFDKPRKVTKQPFEKCCLVNEGKFKIWEFLV